VLAMGGAEGDGFDVLMPEPCEKTFHKCEAKNEIKIPTKASFEFYKKKSYLQMETFLLAFVVG
jgi:hypothetical protein